MDKTETASIDHEDIVRDVATKMLARIDHARLIDLRSQVNRCWWSRFLYQPDAWCAEYAHKAARLAHRVGRLKVLCISGAIGYFGLAFDVLGHDVLSVECNGTARASGVIYDLHKYRFDKIAERPQKYDLLTLRASMPLDKDGVPMARKDYLDCLRLLKKRCRRGYVETDDSTEWLLTKRLGTATDTVLSW